jgi:ABC-type Fe3+/spermidine/putrescine transport system ATPase subunit
MREEIRRIHARTRITTIYVTHDQKEALSLANRMAVLRDGIVEQIGDPRSIYRSPANRFVADFIGETNWFEAQVKSISHGEMTLQTEFGDWQAESPLPVKTGSRVALGFRPEAVQIGGQHENSFQTTITHVSYLGEIEQYGLELAPGKFVKAFEQNPLEIRRVGSTLTVHVRRQDVLVLLAEG